MGFAETFGGCFLGITATIFVMGMLYGGVCTVNIDKGAELKQCQDQVKQLKATVTPQCAPVKCDCGNTGFIVAVMGILIGAVGWGVFHYYNAKTEQITKKQRKK